MAGALALGIGKRELMEDYYADEISVILSEWNALHDPNRVDTQEVDAMTFFGEGGEWA